MSDITKQKTKQKTKRVVRVGVSELAAVEILNEVQSATFAQMETIGVAGKMRKGTDKTGRNPFLDRGVNYKKRNLYILGNTYQDSVNNRIAKVTGENVDEIVDRMVQNAKDNGIDVDDEAAKKVTEVLLNKAQTDTEKYKADKRKYAEHISKVVAHDEETGKYYVCCWPIKSIEKCLVDDSGLEYTPDETQEIMQWIPAEKGSKKQAAHGLTGRNQVLFNNFLIGSINTINIGGRRFRIIH